MLNGGRRSMISILPGVFMSGAVWFFPSASTSEVNAGGGRKLSFRVVDVGQGGPNQFSLSQTLDDVTSFTNYLTREGRDDHSAYVLEREQTLFSGWTPSRLTT